MTSILTYLSWAFALLALLVTSLLILSPKVPVAGFFARLILAWCCLIVCAFYGVIASVFLRCVGYGGLSQWTVARSFKWTMKFAVGVEFVIQGEEHLKTRPAVFIGNHQSELDVLMLGCIFPPYCSVTAKKSLKYIPFLGWFMALSKTVFIDRGNRENARLAFDGAARQMKSEKQSVYIFPEGTRSYTSRPEMLPFKKGAFHLAIQAQVPIVPIVVANYSNVLHLQTRRFTAGNIPVKVLPPISTENLSPADVDDLTKRTRDMMLHELEKLTEVARGQGISVSADKADARDRKSTLKNGGAARQRPVTN